MWMKRKHAFLLIHRNGLLENSLKRVKIENWIDIVINKLNVFFVFPNRILNENYQCIHYPNIIIDKDK